MRHTLGTIILQNFFFKNFAIAKKIMQQPLPTLQLRDTNMLPVNMHTKILYPFKTRIQSTLVLLRTDARGGLKG